MDPRVVITKLQEHFDHSDDGRARAQLVLKMLMESCPSLKELIGEAHGKVVQGRFTPTDCWVLQTLLKRHIWFSRLNTNYGKQQEEAVILICSHTCNTLSQSCYIFQAFYFFYKTMVLVNAAAVLDSPEPGQEIGLVGSCAFTTNGLWRTLFIDTSVWQKEEKATIALLVDLRYLAIEQYENNPGFCYFLCLDLIRGFNVMANSFTEDQNTRIRANLLVLLARCSFQAKQYKLCTTLCQQASELEECTSYIPFKIWAKALYKERQYGVALNRLEIAVKCVTEKEDGEIDQWETVLELQDFIDTLKEKISSAQNQSTEPDPGWMIGTNINIPQIQINQAQRVKDSHVKKKKRSRPTRNSVEKVQVSELDWLKGSPLSQSNPTTQPSLKLNADNNSFLQYKQWDSSGGEEESDLEDAFELPEPEGDEEEPEVTKVKPEIQGRTWFDESRDNHHNSKSISCGMETNVDVTKFEARTYTQTRAPFYKQMKPVEELEQLMAMIPERYKRCRLVLESPHKAVCKVLTATETYHDIEIHGRSKCGQTFNNDEVCVEVLSEPKPSNDSNKVRVLRKMQEDDKVYGQVVGVLKRKFRDRNCPVMACTCDNDEGFLMRPLCRTVLKMHALNGVTKKNHPAMSKHRIDMYEINENRQVSFKTYFDVKPGLKEKYVFLVVYLTWGIHHVYPLGAVVDILECGTDFNGGLKILEMQYQVPTYFPQDTVAHTGEVLKKRDTLLADARVNCTELEVFTIDPAHSKDLDDALSISVEDGHYVIGVHIADVASVVKKGDPVDREAQKRATSFYPCESRTRNMLPEPLSEGMCSLLPNEERLALSVFFHIEKSGKLVKEPTVMKTKIKSSCKLSYENAQKLINDEEVENVSQTLKDNIKLLHEIAQNLRKDRLKDSRFAVPFEDPRFIETEIIEQNIEAHALIEEFMIKANTSIAQWLRKKFPNSIPIRCQSPPSTEDVQKFVQSEDKFLDLVVNLQGQEVLPGRTVASGNWVAKGNTVRKEPLPVQKNIWLQILDGVHDETLTNAVRNMCKDEVHPFQAIALQHWRQIMESAEYKCSMLSEKELNHFSLNTKMYTHFTSPIRRYVDLVVHRLVHAALDGKSCPYSPQEIADICAHVNDATSRQNHFSNGCKALKKASKISQKPMECNAILNNVTDSGAELCIPSLRNISIRSKELPFNLLDLSKKPEEMKDPWTSKIIVTGEWKKRLYDCTGCPAQDSEGHNTLRPKQIPFIVDPHQHVCYVDTQTWAKMLKLVFSKDDKALKKMLNRLSPEGQDPLNRTPVRDMVTSENGDGTINFHHCKFTLCFSPGRVIRVQMVAKPDRGLLTPKVRLFHVCKNLNLCLSHKEDPVGVLSKYATESTNKTIESIVEYQRTWLPLLEMDAVMTAATNEENVIINNVTIDIKQSPMKTYTGSFTLQGTFMRERCIEFGGKSIDKLKEGDDSLVDTGMRKVSSIDYLCIRCPIPQTTNAPVEMQHAIVTDEKETESPRKTKSSKKQKKGKKETEHNLDISNSDTDSYTWVGHAQILKVRRRGKDANSDRVDIRFSLNSNSGPVPECLLTKASGTVEIIMKSEVDRRTMAMLQHLHSENNDLAVAIALNRLLPELENSRLEVGNQIDKEIPLRALPPNNYMQEEAISQALTSSFSLIQGPPGTGKTYTGIKLIYLFEKINMIMHQKKKDKQKKQVLFCGPSNKSVDLVGRLLIKRLGNICPKIIRVYGQNIVSQDYPVPKRNFLSRKSLHGLKSDQKLRQISLHHMIRQQGKPYAKEINFFDSFFQKNHKYVTSDNIKYYSKLIFKASCEELEKCDVILSTCAVGGNMKVITSTNVFQVIIDESAMSTEPQTMVPIIATEAKQVVLMGDHKQLRPIVQCREAADLGLTQSLFERYASDASFLDTQYRMHPKICQIPSDIFYEGQLKTGRSQWWRVDQPLRLWPVSRIPYLLWHVEGTEHVLSVSAEEGNERSRSNKAEVDIVEEVFRWLKEKEKIDPSTINVMSQYNAQCSKIKEKLTRYYSYVNVNTVVASQGGEWDYVILSTVRSLPPYKIERRPTLGWRRQNLGFITDANQINVALTRARKGLIIIGNVNLLRSDDVFRQLITRYEEQGCVVEGQRCPPVRRQSSFFRET
ncbi:helicase with zinc finger domain 2-like [Haliotis rufescens]|uniref:helicase with zinc finger domain 2-like n=1 Tax=Haliotis rufescens TaxID=6454 RepID=UPI00201F747E|nr:helicase with zinc finger domain 2-like [Haliotis rufescens]XP_048256394.1 helicase with zinc finger domain 2-like [Haliotis rufescens]